MLRMDWPKEKIPYSREKDRGADSSERGNKWADYFN